MNIFVLIEIIDNQEFSYPIGYYTTEEIAEKYREESQKSRPDFVYKVQEVELDTPPMALDDEMKKLMDEGFIDQFVSETGDFVWELTDKGKEIMEDDE